MKLFLTIFLFLPSSLAFSIGKRIMRVEDLRLMSKEDDVEPQRKPRFAQQVHVAKKIQSSKNLSSDKSHTRKVSDESTRKSSGKILQDFTAKGNENVPQKSNESPSGLGKDFMWKTGKSIEDIEATMAKRWGTEVEKWTANPDDYELEEDSPSTTSQSQNFYRGKPVADPWEVKERKSKSLPTYSETDHLPSDFGEKRVLDKARRNQRDIQSRSRVKKPSWTNLVDDEVTSVTDRDFYDEDDEGFETDGPRGKKKSTSSIGTLISPKPVGGKGSIESESQHSSETYFFNPGAKFLDSSSLLEPNEPTAPTKREGVKKIRSGLPLLDNDGNSMYLTLSQANKNFRSILMDDTLNSETLTLQPAPQISWDGLGITSNQLIKNLDSMTCGSPLSIQIKSCASILTGKDIIIGTYTGSGKTLSFLVPLAQRLLSEVSAPNDGVQVLIIAPGRELASQIAGVARSLLEGSGLSTVLAIGGTTFSRNFEQIRRKKPAILVGTPGRIAELVVGQPGERFGRMKISSIRTVVFDEFDALLQSKAHSEPTSAIIQMLKKRHGDKLQSILCSATASDMIESDILKDYFRPGCIVAMADKDDKLVTGDDSKKSITRVSRTVLHGVVHVSRKQLALDTIRKILHTEPIPQQVLIFADNARRVDLVVEKLGEMDIIAAPLHGGVYSEKSDRAEVSKALREGYVGIVVATELAARGIDAPLLTHVINLDLPTDSSHYAHRAGRCGRGGRPGVVINITTNAKERNVPKKFSEQLGVDMFTVEPRGGKLTILDPSTLTLDN